MGTGWYLVIRDSKYVVPLGEIDRDEWRDFEDAYCEGELFSEYAQDSDEAPWLKGYRHDPEPGIPSELRDGWEMESDR